MKIVGSVVSGLKKGSRYVTEYMQHFERALGFTCHPGTLNMNVKNRPILDETKKVHIAPDNDDLGKVDCYLVRINETYDGAIVVPHKTQHNSEILEVIAPVDLRERLKLQDGDEVTCELV